jgi:hypothetical protein
MLSLPIVGDSAGRAGQRREDLHLILTPRRHQPDELDERLTVLGWKINVHPVGWRFFYATGRHLTKK